MPEEEKSALTLWCDFFNSLDDEGWERVESNWVKTAVKKKDVLWLREYGYDENGVKRKGDRDSDSNFS
jgi:hypothetical protein